MMMKPLRLASLLLVSTAFAAPSLAWAQDTPADASSEPAEAAPQDDAAVADDQAAAEEAAPDISAPGAGEIVVRGRRGTNVVRTTPQVISVLSTADIARTGEGDIAGALSRVTGLSVVGNGYVYVRGLGDRYSLALLNGSPLPSPEPLKRVVPLDIFPTDVIASSLVQKSYSPNYPGEFGGGVINLTTQAIPTETFLTISGSIGGDTFTTGNLGYVYAGGGKDWTGFDDGTRDVPPALQAFFDSRERLSDIGRESNGTDLSRELIGSQLVNAKTALVQRRQEMPFNWSTSLSAGTSLSLGGDTQLGIITSFGYDTDFRTRDTVQQTAGTADLSQKIDDFRAVLTDQHTVVNALVGVGLEFGEHKLRWTNLYIRDTSKLAKLESGVNSESLAFVQNNQDTAWYERQLIDTQLVGEFRFEDMSIDLRAAYANSQREAPFETSIGYVLIPSGPYAGNYVNRLNDPRGFARVAFSDLEEELYSGGIDFSYAFSPKLTVSAGYAYTDTDRTSSRRSFRFNAPGTFPDGVSLMRPDNLLGGAVIDAFDVDIAETTETDPAFIANLVSHAYYLKGRISFSDAISLDTGVRYETARQSVAPLQVFNTPSNSGASNKIDADYWLPAATLTWEIAPQMQIRASGSKTLARPQFRELLFQQYYDPDSNRLYRGNPALADSQLWNAEARWEWYFDRDQRVSVAGFYKHIDNPIEAYTTIVAEGPVTSFANAPQATLYGAEVELQKYFTGLIGSRRGVVIANYTWSKSKVKVADGDITLDYRGTGIDPARPASELFQDGRPLTGQSDHLVNLQVGLEDEDHLSQQTILFSYASKRLTARGPGSQPDIYEYPGIRLDFVMRQGITIGGVELEAKLEVRNITGTGYKEYQESGENRIYYNLYDVGTSGSLGLSLKF